MWACAAEKNDLSLTVTDYVLKTVDYRQVVASTGDEPIETAQNDIRRVGIHARFGEFRVQPVGEERDAGLRDTPRNQRRRHGRNTERSE